LGRAGAKLRQQTSLLPRWAEGGGMKGVELYRQVRRAVYVEGLSRREAARIRTPETFEDLTGQIVAYALAYTARNRGCFLGFGTMATARAVSQSPRALENIRRTMLKAISIAQQTSRAAHRQRRRAEQPA
jgi:hypothetical protein